MTAPDSLPSAWEPLTPRGVAAFARATRGRLWLVQSLVALIVAASVAWLLYDGWFPTIREAIRQLPVEGEIRSGRLDWPEDAPRLLAEGRLLALSVDLEHEHDLRSPSHVQVEFGRNDLLVDSLFGYVECPYPRGWIIAFNRKDLEPWWGAWQPEILAMAAAGVVVGLLMVWSILAWIYLLPVWLVGFFANRDLDLRAGRRLAGAALMPGALLLAIAVLAYDLGFFDLVSLLFVWGAHWVLGWIYLLISPLFLPRLPALAPQGRNPFARPPAGGPKSGVGKPGGGNP